MTDELQERLEIERPRAGRGSLRTRRDLWRFCARAFREWNGLHLVDHGPSILEVPLTTLEMVGWLELARDFPASARDVLRLQRQAISEHKRLTLREVEEGHDERRLKLLELHEMGLIAAHHELTIAQKALEKAVRDQEQFANGPTRIEHRRRMIIAAEKTIADLSDQVQILRTTARSRT